MTKLNCWQFKKCGRQPGGQNTGALGVCPAASEDAAGGINCGTKGGRACWALAGTLCGGVVQGTFASKLVNCMQCDFYKLVLAQEGKDFVPSKKIQDRINEKKKKE